MKNKHLENFTTIFPMSSFSLLATHIDLGIEVSLTRKTPDGFVFQDLLNPTAWEKSPISILSLARAYQASQLALDSTSTIGIICGKGINHV